MFHQLTLVLCKNLHSFFIDDMDISIVHIQWDGCRWPRNKTEYSQQSAMLLIINSFVEENIPRINIHVRIIITYIAEILTWYTVIFPVSIAFIPWYSMILHLDQTVWTKSITMKTNFPGVEIAKAIDCNGEWTKLIPQLQIHCTVGPRRASELHLYHLW